MNQQWFEASSYLWLTFSGAFRVLYSTAAGVFTAVISELCDPVDSADSVRLSERLGRWAPCDLGRSAAFESVTSGCWEPSLPVGALPRFEFTSGRELMLVLAHCQSVSGTGPLVKH